MKQLIIYLFIVTHFIHFVNAQEIFSVAGADCASRYGQISWTLGESVCETLHTNGVFVTQGFQQPILEISTLVQAIKTDYSISAYPNPTSDFFTIKITNSDFNHITYSLYSLDGRLVDVGEVFGNEAKVQVDNLQKAVYQMIVRDSGNIVKSFKIMKR